MSEQTEVEFPAMRTVHWPSGPVHACDRHSVALVGLGRFLGAHVAMTLAPKGATCQNCENEAKNREEPSQ